VIASAVPLISQEMDSHMKHQESRSKVSPADKPQEDVVMRSADVDKMAQESLEE